MSPTLRQCCGDSRMARPMSTAKEIWGRRAGDADGEATPAAAAVESSVGVPLRDCGDTEPSSRSCVKSGGGGRRPGPSRGFSPKTICWDACSIECNGARSLSPAADGGAGERRLQPGR